MKKSLEPKAVINPTLVHEIFDLQSQYRPDELALEFEGRSKTYSEICLLVNQTANYLSGLGLSRGDRIAWVATNIDVFWSMFFGAAKIGVVIAPLNWRLSPIEITEILGDMSASYLFSEERFLNAILENSDNYSGKAIPIDEALEATIAKFSKTSPKLDIDPEDTVLQLYTSGTTGLPKGVMLTHRCFHCVAESQFSIGAIRPTYENEVILNVLPHFHIAGVTLGLLGWKQTMPLRQHRGFEVEKILKEAERGDPINAFFVPAMINMLVDAAKSQNITLYNIACVSYGAAPMPQSLLVRALTAMPNASFYQFYGMTETTGGLTVLGANDHFAGAPKLASAGKAIPGCAVKIVDPETGIELEAGKVGEITTCSNHIMKGYWNRPDATNESMSHQFYKTGDAGYKDEMGYIFIVDRIKDMIISGGENIYPAELEQVLDKHPEIGECAVFGVPDIKWGEVVSVLVVPILGAELSSQMVLEFLSAKIARFKLPRHVYFGDALPRNASGKVLKRKLKEIYSK